MNSWKVDATKILSRSEIGAVLADVKRRGKRRSSVNTRQNLVIFRLATCCGLRASELCGLKINHVVTGVRRPYLNVPKAIAKGRKARRVPLWWDAGTLADLESWKAERAPGSRAGRFVRMFAVTRIVRQAPEPAECQSAIHLDVSRPRQASSGRDHDPSWPTQLRVSCPCSRPDAGRSQRRSRTQ